MPPKNQKKAKGKGKGKQVSFDGEMQTSPRIVQQATPPSTPAGKVSEVVLGGGRQQQAKKVEKPQAVEDFVWDGSWAFEEGSEERNRWDTTCVKDQADFIISDMVIDAICKGTEDLPLGIIVSRMLT